MVLVDTSVWIDFLKDVQNAQTEKESDSFNHCTNTTGIG
jgi:predicted nucleic acid-binding protein